MTRFSTVIVCGALAQVVGIAGKGFAPEGGTGAPTTFITMNEDVIRNYIRHQEQEDERLDRLALCK